MSRSAAYASLQFDFKSALLSSRKASRRLPRSVAKRPRDPTRSSQFHSRLMRACAGRSREPQGRSVRGLRRTVTHRQQRSEPYLALLNGKRLLLGGKRLPRSGTALPRVGGAKPMRGGSLPRDCVDLHPRYSVLPACHSLMLRRGNRMSSRRYSMLPCRGYKHHFMGCDASLQHLTSK